MEAAFRHLANEYLRPTMSPSRAAAPAPVAKLTVTPDQGCYHPDREALGLPYLQSPSDYLAWYRAAKGAPPDAPVVAVLLYRKHVITRQPYLNQLARRGPTHVALLLPRSTISVEHPSPSTLLLFDRSIHHHTPIYFRLPYLSGPQVYGLEEQGLIPVPIFINGIEAHTVVRDLLTSAHERAERAAGRVLVPSLKANAIQVDAVVSTIGFPLVGAPAAPAPAPTRSHRRWRSKWSCAALG